MRVILGLSLTAAAALYALVAVAVVWRIRQRGRALISPVTAPVGPAAAEAAAIGPPALAAISVLKPLCGSEPGLYQQLRSFCVQHYPIYQLVFGVREASDPAIQTVHRLQREFPACDITLVIEPTLHGCNYKVSNLMNMLPAARHPWLVLSDSDVTVPPEYLAQVAAPLADPAVGLVTCPYIGRPTGGISAELGAMFINDWFMPSVHVAAAFGSSSYVSGATIALRRDVLAAIGGLPQLADQLADDHRLGELVRRQGLSIVLSALAVETSVNEGTLGSLCRHELRWLRTVRAVQPLGYALCFPTFPLVTGLAGSALAGFGPAALIALGITAAARLMLHYFVGSGGARVRLKQLGLLPLREALLAALWAWSFFKREIVWREQRFGIGQDGSLHLVGGSARRMRFRKQVSAIRDSQ
jgi:ceramide glucosyltransferase